MNLHQCCWSGSKRREYQAILERRIEQGAQLISAGSAVRFQCDKG
jgi:hypothetical protein